MSAASATPTLHRAKSMREEDVSRRGEGCDRQNGIATLGGLAWERRSSSPRKFPSGETKTTSRASR